VAELDINKKSIYSRVFQVPWISILIGAVLLALLLSVLQPAFFSIVNFKNIFLAASIVGIMAIGETFVIMSGGIDISVAMNVFLMMSLMSEVEKILPAPAVLLVGIIGGTSLGVLSGFLVSKLKIPPLIATLATLAIARGFGYLIIQSKMRSVEESTRVLGTTQVFGLPLPIIIMAVMIVIGHLLLKKTRFGRYALAIGDDEIAARESGIPIERIQFLTYAFNGFCAGLASLVFIGRLGTVQTDTAYGMEFQVITAVVLGGTKLIGGKGTVIGALIGALFLTLIENGMNLMELNIFYYDIARGLILFIAVVIDQLSYNRKQRALILERALRIRS
jgi:ribose transport system permease protein